MPEIPKLAFSAKGGLVAIDRAILLSSEARVEILYVWWFWLVEAFGSINA